MSSIFDIPLKTIDGRQTDLKEHEGKVLLIVNTASACGYTPQYAGLQALQEKFSGRSFSVLGFPSNDFGAQEPGADAEIARFCDLKFRVRFPLYSKIPTVGATKHPLYAHLTQNAPQKGEVEWNFEKFLLGKDGRVLARFRSDVEPDSDAVLGALEKALA